jgi:hypothetical protein
MLGINLGPKNKLKIAPVLEGPPMRVDKNAPAFEVLINPAGYKRQLSIRYNKQQTLGQPAGHVRFSSVRPEKLTLPELVFDGTGIVSLYGSSSVDSLIETMLGLLYRVKGDKHEPNTVCFQWGDMNYYGRVETVDIDYTMFKPTGEPLRAKVKLGILGGISVKEGLLRANLSSPDLSHLVQVRAGDTLPLLCNRIYRNPAYYTVIARLNGLVDFRNLEPGTMLRFPPLK